MIGGLTKGDKAAEAGKIGDQLGKDFCIGPTSLNREVYYSRLIYYTLKELYSQLGDISYANKTRSEKEIIDFYVLPQFARFKEIIDEGIKKDPSFANSAIVKFCYSIIKDNKLLKELEEVSIPAKNSSVKARVSFQLKNLKERVWFLGKLKEEKNFTAIQKAYRDEWSFYDLINDRDFKQMYIDKAVTESANKSFKEDIDKYIELAEQGKKAASKYFERKDVELRAYYTKTDNADRVLNINLINYNRSEPTRVSDILQQEKDIKELNIYCNKKHEIHAHQEDKKRYYEFKEGAYYEMTSTWPVKDEFGNVSICTMIMNVSSDGITEVLKFNGEDFVSSEEILELIKQNDELYIQGFSLHDAVMKSLEKGKAADVVPTANNNLQNESIVAYQDKEPGGESKSPDPKVDADNSLPPSSPPSINSNSSTQTEVNLQQIAIQTEINSQQTETQTEVNLQHTKTQTEVASQQIETQTEVNLQRTGTQTEIDSQQTETQTELSLQEVAIQTEVDLQHTETQTEVASQHIGIQTEINSQQITDLQSESEKAKQRIEELEKQNSDLQDGFRKKEQKNTELQTELAQKDEELAELQGKAQELKSVCEEKGKLRQELEVVNAKKEELKSELKELKKELSQVQEEESDLEDKSDHLEQSNKKMNGNQEQLSEQVLGLQKELSELKEENQALSNKLESAQTEKKRANQELAEAEQRTEALEKQISDLQDKLEKKERGSKAKIDAMCKELTQLKENLERNEEKLKSVYEEKRRLEDKLKVVNVEKKKSEDELKKFEEDIDQVIRIMEEKEQFISNLKRQMQELEDEYKAQLESMDREHEDEIKELEEKHDALSDIIAGKVLDIEGLTKELQDSKKEIEDLRNQVEMLSAETFADKQKGFNNQFYTLTGDISSEPDNVPRKKIELSRSLSFDSESDNESYVPLEGERRSLRSSSIDDGYGSDKENCDDDLSSNITTTSIEKVAESRNVGKALL